MRLLNNFIGNRILNKITVLILFGFLLISEVKIFTSIGFALTVYSFLSFIRNLGDSLPVIDLMLLLCGYQWIVASYYSYIYGDPNYPMEVSESTYMSITVLLYIGLFIGVKIIKPEIILNNDDLKSFMSQKKNGKFALYFIFTGVVALALKSVFPGSLMFFHHLLTSLMYIGSIMLIYSENKLKWYFFIIAFGYLFVKVVSGGVFNEFLSWGFFLLMFLVNFFKISKSQILFFIIISIFSISVLQSVKPYYRSIIWNGYQGNRVALFFEVFADNLTGQINNTDSNKGLYEGLNSRANQGWVYSKVYNQVPDVVPFANGATIRDAIIDSFLPRILFPDKKPTFDRDLFIKYTGKELNSNTAMGLGIIGEAYANFGKWGSFLFMLGYGLILASMTKFYNKKSLMFPILIFMVPLYYEMVIRAISNFSQVINWQMKVGLLLIILLLIYRNYTNQLKISF